MIENKNVINSVDADMQFNPDVEGYFSDVCVEGGGVKLPPGVSQLLD